MEQVHTRRLESRIYIGLWALVVALYLIGIMRERSYSELPMIDMAVLVRMVCFFVPFVVLFTVNNSVLIPRLLATNRYGRYLLLTLLLVLVVWILQGGYFFYEMSQHTFPEHIKIPRGPRPLIPWPLFMELLYDLLILGVNLAIALLFQRLADSFEHECLSKANAENQLAYLKTQINPHFYMNMLNNIHGMIGIDPEKAQEMVIDMSRLMRYTLYESSNPRIALSKEVGFLSNYMDLMRQRYPADKVSVTAVFPTDDAMDGVMVPPLLFLVFVENSFKHGVSYSEDSFITADLGIDCDSGMITFSCLNSVHRNSVSSSAGKGIGLKNVRQRLDLIYDEKYSLEVHETDTTYLLTLNIPAHETSHSDN